MNKRMKSLSPRVAGRASAAQLGMTLIEIMIVLAIIAVVMGILVGPRVMRMWRKSRDRTAMLRAQQFVEAHTEWSMNNDEACPSSLDDLLRYMNNKETDDPWGSQYILVCGEDAPDGVPFGVVSKGEDKNEGTTDDIKSWEHR